MTTIKLKNGSGAPTAGDLVQGEPALDLTNKRLYTEDSGGTVIEVGTNPTSITTGDITATGTVSFAGLGTTGNVTFGDNDKAIFGAGSDLQIYHNGSNSYINDTSGTGNLYLASNQLIINNAANTENMARFVENGAATLYYDGAAKLATTSTGIDVTGTVTADDMVISDGSPTLTFYETDTTNLNARFDNGGGDLYIQTVHDDGSNAKTRILIDHSDGDISFYNSAGSSQDLYWDASASSLGLGTTSPSTYDSRVNNLVVGDSGDAGITIFSGASNYARLQFAPSGDTGLNNGLIGYDNANDKMSFATAGSDRMYIDNVGNVGIGTQSPNQLLTLGSSTGSATIGLDFDTTGVSRGSILYNAGAGEMAFTSGYSGYGGYMTFDCNGAERMRIDSSGNVGIGTSNTSSNKFTVSGDSADGTQVRIVGATDENHRLSLGFDTTNLVGKIQAVHAGTAYKDLALQSEGGNVGIGTSSPYRTLTVSGDQVVEGLLEVTAATPQILFSVPSGGLDSRIHNDGSGNFIFGTGTNSATPTERMRISSGGDVQIGTAAVTGGRYFDIYNTGSTATDFAIARLITQQVGSSSTISADVYKRKNGEFGFANNDTNSAAYINFKVGASDRMRIDSSGNLLVGTTNTYPADNNVTGHSLTAVGQLQSSISGYAPFIGNRKASDGDIAVFKKDGTTVGSIGTGSGAFFIGGGDTNLTFNPAGDNIYPSVSGSTAVRDAAVDLGTSSARFKDLYLSGGAYLGGTAAANHLDDYEEGAFTPAVIGNTTTGTGTYTFQYGSYTKVGRLVFVNLYLRVTAHTGTGDIGVTLPFTVASGATQYGAVSTGEIQSLTSTASTYISGYSIPGGAYLLLRQITTAANKTASSIPMDTSFDLLLSLTYNSA